MAVAAPPLALITEAGRKNGPLPAYPARNNWGTYFWQGYTTGTAFGLAGYPRAHVNFRLLHVFAFRDGLIAREDVWIDYPALQAQLSTAQQAST